MKKRAFTLTILLSQFTFALTPVSLATTQNLRARDEVIDAQVERALEMVTREQLNQRGAIQNSVLPMSELIQAQALEEYNHLDPQKVVPTKALKQALTFFNANKSIIKNQNYLTIADMSQHANKKRMYLINMNSGAVTPYYTAHGKGSDKNNDGYADTFSNVDGSLMTSLGFYLTDVTYSGAHGYSMRLRGLQATNSNAYARAIVVHGASYVNSSHVGRSFGCPAVEERLATPFINMIKGKSLLYIYK